MTHLAKISTIFFLIYLAMGAMHLSFAKGEGPGILEETKQVLSGKESDDASQWITDKTGQYLPLDLQFVDEAGLSVRLGDIIDRPTILLPIYFFCPNICSRNLANLAVAMNSLSAKPGKDYRVIALSFNDAEGYKDAAAAKNNYLKILPDDFPAGEWRFLTGNSEAIKAATDAVGFRFQKVDDETFIHPAALMALAADGRIIRYVYGSFLAGDIDLAISAAAAGTPVMAVRRLLGFCFNYDPHGKTSVFQTVKIVVLLVFGVALVLFILYFKRKGRETKKALEAEGSIRK
ncbi:MAG: SCO family protein [Proteobacteria bacterium]|nr:SCO family protein [Pseudomonadota bacterium]